MNLLVTLAGATALMTTAGHFTAGTKMYLKPLLASDIEPVAKKVLHCVFHYVSVFLVLSTAALLWIGLGMADAVAVDALARFIALNYIAFGIWQLVLAKLSGIPSAPVKMFQWVFFFVIAALALWGSSGSGSL